MPTLATIATFAFSLRKTSDTLFDVSIAVSLDILGLLDKSSFIFLKVNI